MPELTKAVTAARNWRVTQRHFEAIPGTNKYVRLTEECRRQVAHLWGQKQDPVQDVWRT